MRRSSASLPSLRLASTILGRGGPLTAASAAFCAAFSDAQPPTARSSRRRARPGRRARPRRCPAPRRTARRRSRRRSCRCRPSNVLLVAEVEQGLAVDDADADGRHADATAAESLPSECIASAQRDVGAGDGRGAGAAVGLTARRSRWRWCSRPAPPGRRTARSARPISRLISWVRPPILPFTDSRWLRVLVARGSIAYSAVIQPRPLPCRQRGTPCSTLAAHSTRVSPNSIRTDPAGCGCQPRCMRTGRSSSLARPPGRPLSGVVTSGGHPFRRRRSRRVRRRKSLPNTARWLRLSTARAWPREPRA